MRISAVAFDVDGTLYPNRMMYRLSIPVFLGHPRFTYHYNSVRKELRRQDSYDNFREQQADLLAARLGTSRAKASELIQRRVYEQWTESLRRIRPFPYLRETLTALRDRGLKLGVMSDYPPRQKLGYLGVEDFFSCAMASEDSGYLKPDRRPFMRLAECLECVPSQILYVGDSYDYDVRGASGVGMHTAHLTRKRATRRHCLSEPTADIRFSSYKVLPELVDQAFD